MKRNVLHTPFLICCEQTKKHHLGVSLFGGESGILSASPPDLASLSLALFLLKTCHRQLLFTQKALSGFESPLCQTKKHHLGVSLFGGESGIRTHGRRNRHRFSRPALSTTQTSLHLFLSVYNIANYSI